MGHAKRIRKLRMAARRRRRDARQAWRSTPQLVRDAATYTLMALVHRDMDRMLAGQPLRTCDLMASFRDGLEAAYWKSRADEAWQRVQRAQKERES